MPNTTITKGRIRYTVSAGNRYEVPDNNMGSSAAVEVTGFTTNGNEGYCVKQNAAGNKATLYRISNIHSSSVSLRSKKTINYGTFGMTFYNNYLYIASKDSTVIKTSAVTSGDTPTVYSVKYNDNPIGVEAIAHYTGNQFIVMAKSLNEENNTYLCFLVGTFSDTTKEFQATKRFYVRNTSGNTTLQDIHYESQLGLFIATNKMSGSNFTGSSTIIRAEIDGTTELEYNGFSLYNPVAEYVLTANSNRYSRLNIESMDFTQDGKLYVATNLVPSSESAAFETSGIFYINTITFGKSVPSTVSYQCGTGVNIGQFFHTDSNGIEHNFNNPGALALDENKAYCLRTVTKLGDLYANKASILMKSDNVTNTDLTKVTDQYLTSLGHGNGMTFYNNSLYVAAYIRDDYSPKKEIVKISTNCVSEAVYQCDNYIGGISCYKKDDEGREQFIVVNYDTSDTKPYARNPEFFVGTLQNGSFVINKTFCANNPTYKYDKDKKINTVLQDIFYSPEHGLFFITYVQGVSRIYRITPEQIEASTPSVPIMPKEMFINGNNSNREIESLATNNNGVMFLAENSGTGYVRPISNVIFYTDEFNI